MTINVKISSDRKLDIKNRRFGGIQGDIGGVSIDFDVSEIAGKDNQSWRVEFVGCAGTYESTVPITPTENHLIVDVPTTIRNIGGTAQVYLIEELIIDSEVKEKICSYPLRIYFYNKPKGKVEVSVTEYERNITDMYLDMANKKKEIADNLKNQNEKIAEQGETIEYHTSEIGKIKNIPIINSIEVSGKIVTVKCRLHDFLLTNFMCDIDLTQSMQTIFMGVNTSGNWFISSTEPEDLVCTFYFPAVVIEIENGEVVNYYSYDCRKLKDYVDTQTQATKNDYNNKINKVNNQISAINMNDVVIPIGIPENDKENKLLTLQNFVYNSVYYYISDNEYDYSACALNTPYYVHVALEEVSEEWGNATFIVSENSLESGYYKYCGFKVFDTGVSYKFYCNNAWTLGLGDRFKSIDKSKAEQSQVDSIAEGLGGVQATVENKADTSYVDGELGKKSDVSYVDNTAAEVLSITKQYSDEQDLVLNQRIDDLQTYKADESEISDLKAYIGYTDSDIYGVEVDFKNRKLTRLAGAVGKTHGDAFDGVKAFGGRRRCNVTDDGKVIAYYGDAGFSETGVLTSAITIGENTYPTGTKVQVMVEQPKFYYKVVPLELEKIQGGKGFHMRKARYYVSDTMKAGFKLHPAFIKDGKEKNFVYLSAYEGSTYDTSASAYKLNDAQDVDWTNDVLASIAGAKPTSGLTQSGATRNGFRTIAAKRGSGWSQQTIQSVSATQILFLVEYASFNIQEKLGAGVTTKVDDGATSMTEITGATTTLGNKSGQVINTNGYSVVAYRGEENPFGNIWKWVDGINTNNGSTFAEGDTGTIYVADHGFKDNSGDAPYHEVGFSSVYLGWSYISAFGYAEDDDWLFYPTEGKGNSSLPVGDSGQVVNSGWRVAVLGATWHVGSSSGLFCLNVYNDSGYRSRTIGGRLIYIPTSREA